MRRLEVILPCGARVVEPMEAPVGRICVSPDGDVPRYLDIYPSDIGRGFVAERRERSA